jgi:hypothetical protein
MESVLTTLAAWMGNASSWLQSSTGMSVKDLALFAGGILIVIGVLLLGLYSGKPRYREAAGISWLVLFAGIAVFAWGLYNRHPGAG